MVLTLFICTLTYPVLFIGLINVRCAATAEQRTGHYTDPRLLCSLSVRIVFTVVRPADPCIVLRRRIIDPIILGTIK